MQAHKFLGSLHEEQKQYKEAVRAYKKCDLLACFLFSGALSHCLSCSSLQLDSSQVDISIGLASLIINKLRSTEEIPFASKLLSQFVRAVCSQRMPASLTT
jgi:hypothetical protein